MEIMNKIRLNNALELIYNSGDVESLTIIKNNTDARIKIIERKQRSNLFAQNRGYAEYKTVKQNFAAGSVYDPKITDIAFNCIKELTLK
jgi:uncharacterized protein (UPF0218 family)